MTFEQSMKSSANSSDVRNALNRDFQALKQERLTTFSNRGKLLKDKGVTDAALLGNADVLAGIVKTLGYPGGNAPDATASRPAPATPRSMFGTPGQGRSTPGGFAPPKSGGKGSIYHDS